MTHFCRISLSTESDVRVHSCLTECIDRCHWVYLCNVPEKSTALADAWSICYSWRSCCTRFVKRCL